MKKFLSHEIFYTHAVTDVTDNYEVCSSEIPGDAEFQLKHTGNLACGIPHKETIIMTGGGNHEYAHNYVTR